MTAFTKCLPTQRVKPPAKTVVVRNSIGQPLIFGMDWTAIVGGQPLKLARKHVRLVGATHYLLVGAPATTVGCVQLEKQYFAQSCGIYSAAALFSVAYPSAAVACLVRFEEGGSWMVASHSGSIVSETDRWFVNTQAAVDALNDIRVRFPNLVVHEQLIASSTQLPAWLNEKCSEQARVLSQQTAREGIKTRAAALALIIFLGVWIHWFYQRPAHDDTLTQVQPTQRWADAMVHYAQQHPMHRFSDLLQVMTAWRRVPFDPVGWQLLRVQCEPVLLDWSCAAHYRRRHRFALNQHLEAVKPAEWDFHAVALDRATLTWSLSHAAQPLDLTLEPVRVDWMSSLQRLSPLFEHIQLGLAAKLSIHAPLDSQGRPLERPAGLPNWHQRSLALKGPLRALSALQELTTPVRWRSATLEVGNISGQELTRSVLVVQLIGDLFEYIQY
ncbi:MAG: hypothetical protein WCG12_12500 [Alcaligenaceae bacterium]